ncbi:BnaC06g00010D [Brassica napus]|uniref:BnaC06g00010D protein n=1 Tax=Brassica napus TaxID=3708 RepID=A0A078FXJ5_BRANA|nr:BnaC06g00010D [Brassica napus]
MLELSIELTVRLCVNLMGRNTSLIDYCQSNGKHKYIQIDFTLHNIPQADSMILTDEHADSTPIFYLRNLWKFSLNFLDIEAAMITCFSENSLAAKFPFILIIHGTSMMHGEYNVYLGFFFWRKNPVWLISPMYHVLHQALSMVKCNKVLSVCYWWSQLDLLILDSIYKKGSHNTHLCFLQRQPKDLNTKRALLEFLEERSER